MGLEIDSLNLEKLDHMMDMLADMKVSKEAAIMIVHCLRDEADMDELNRWLEKNPTATESEVLLKMVDITGPDENPEIL